MDTTLVHQYTQYNAFRSSDTEVATSKNSNAGCKYVPSHTCDAHYACPSFPTRACVLVRLNLTSCAPDTHGLLASVSCYPDVLCSATVNPDIHTRRSLLQECTRLLRTDSLPFSFTLSSYVAYCDLYHASVPCRIHYNCPC